MRKLSIIALFCFALNLQAQVDLDVMNKIRHEGLHHSQVMDILGHLSDEIGSRLTGSPAMIEANHWTRDTMQSWGLEAYLDPFEFGRGWSYESVRLDLVTPRKTSLHGIPVAWSPGTEGAVKGDVIYMDVVTVEELEGYRGKLGGKIVLVSPSEKIEKPSSNEIVVRETSSTLKRKSEFYMDRPESHAPTSCDVRHWYDARRDFRQALAKFLAEEKPLAVLYRSRRNGGPIGLWGHDHRVGKTFPVPSVILSAEHYELLVRLLEKGDTPNLEMDVDASFHDEDTRAYNTIGVMKGTDPRAGVVMAGGHLDSWHGGTGTVDNGAGVAVAMEAVRILKAIGVKPKRSIMVGLWSGEEQGLYGSKAYVDKTLATRPKPEDPDEASLYYRAWKSPGWPITTRPAHDKFSVYFNMDNGSGKFRGIYTEGNIAAGALFRSWFSPFSDLSEGVISPNSTGSTDHKSFDDVGLPGFQFIQDRLDYSSRLWHSHVDTLDHASEDDLRQAATILAGFLYQAATMDELVPRKPMPKEPSKAEQEKAKRKGEKALRDKQRKALEDLRSP